MYEMEELAFHFFSKKSIRVFFQRRLFGDFLNYVRVPTRDNVCNINYRFNLLVIGHVSLRNILSGTWYVNALVETFRSYHRDEDVMSMMTRVNDMVSKAYSKSGYKQCPAPIFTLTKKIFS